MATVLSTPGQEEDIDELLRRLKKAQVAQPTDYASVVQALLAPSARIDPEVTAQI